MRVNEKNGFARNWKFAQIGRTENKLIPKSNKNRFVHEKSSETCDASRRLENAKMRAPNEGLE